MHARHVVDFRPDRGGKPYASSTALRELRRILVSVPLFQWHQRALDIAEQIGCVRSQGRAYGNLGLTYEALGKHERAVVFQEQHLSVAAQTNDLLAKTLAYGSLGRIHHALQNYAQAVMYLQEGRNATNRRFDPPKSCVFISSMLNTLNSFLLFSIDELARCTKLRESFFFSTTTLRSSTSECYEQMFDSGDEKQEEGSALALPCSRSASFAEAVDHSARSDAHVSSPFFNAELCLTFNYG